MSAFLHPFARPTATDFLTLVRGQGALVFDDRGRDYVDAMASLWFCDVGHGRRETADTVGAQLGTLAAFHAFDRFTNEPAEELAAALSLARADARRPRLPHQQRIGGRRQRSQARTGRPHRRRRVRPPRRR
ncbi:MAG: hypothetical protein M3P93_02545 [Actinomycetota bacterium]|nr:hypothetical protein [Actinomycetota bacterium]